MSGGASWNDPCGLVQERKICSGRQGCSLLNSIHGTLTTVATINFKGGVGKTTVHLANVAAATMQHPTLLFDLDAQMSLTQAVAWKWNGSIPLRSVVYGKSNFVNKRTLFHAIEAYTSPKNLTISTFQSKYDFTSR